MSHPSANCLARLGLGGLLLALLGCSRSAVVVVPESTGPADESASSEVARGKVDESTRAPFVFPKDTGGDLLAKVLPPTDSPSRRTAKLESSPTPPAPVRMSVPALPLPPSPAALPRLPASSPAAPLRPRLILDETLGGLPDTPVLPEQTSFPVGGRVRAAARDVNEPLPLPILGQPILDRASLEDPTTDASTAAALAASMPARTTKAAFLKLTLPDPYDHRRSHPVPSPQEQTEPPLGSPPTPRR